MVSERNRINKLVEYIKSFDIDINIGKNKAQGNKGFFKTNGKYKRIDISKNAEQDEILSILLHEFSHFKHYSYDKNLETLDFILEHPLDDTLLNEYIELTVSTIDKSNITKLFEQKENCEKKINEYSKLLKNKYSDFRISKPIKKVETILKQYNLQSLLKCDKVKFYNFFETKIHSIDTLSSDFPELDESITTYLKLKSEQRIKKRINNRISKLNKYYNSTTELFARSIELFFLKPQIFKQKAPNLYKIYSEKIKNNKFEWLSKLNKIINSN